MTSKRSRSAPVGAPAPGGDGVAVLPGAAIVFDSRGRVRDCREAAARLFGYRADELRGLAFADLFDGEAPAPPLPALPPLEDVDRVLLARRKDGGTFPALVLLSPLDEGEAPDFSCALRDASLLNGSGAAGGQSLRAEILAHMGHELRTPLNAIIGFIRLVEEGLYTTESERQDFLGSARKSALSLLELINNLLDLARIETGRLALASVELDPAALVEEVTKTLSPQAHEKGVEIECLLERALPARLQGDPVRLRQVLYNLAGNAVKFTDSGLVLLRVELESTEEKVCRLRFSVEDTGMGVDEELRPHIFDSFVRTPRSRPSRLDGVGLGLSISKQIVEQMGGAIDMESQVARGSTFWFSVPLGLLDGAQPRSLPPGASLGEVRLLLLNPDARTAAVYRELLTGLGAALDTAATPEEAEALLQAGWEAGRPHRAVLVDHHLRLDQALVFARGVRGHGERFQPDLVHLAPIGAVSELGALSEAGYSASLTKPVMALPCGESLRALLARQTVGGVPPRPGSESAGMSTDRPGGEPVSERLLVVEDNAVNQKLINALLTKQGYRVTLVSNGREAVEAVQSHCYDLVLMDVQMPVMDGLAATRAIRELTPPAHPPIIAMTADALDGDRERCLAAGMDDYLSKPIMPDVLLAKLAEWLGPGDAGGGEGSLQEPGETIPFSRTPRLDLVQLDAVQAYAARHDPQDFTRWVCAFLEDLQDARAGLEEAGREESWPALGKRAERIYLLCGGFGAPRLRELARELIHHARKRARVLIHEHLAHLEREHRALQEELARRYDTKAPPAP